MARKLAKLMEPKLKVSMPIINVPGATGQTGLTKMLTAPADGYAFFDREPNTEVAVGAPVAWIADTARAPKLDAAASSPAAGASSGAAERFTRKARKLMKERGLTEAAFPGGERVDAETVERVAERGGAGPAAAPRIPPGVRPLEVLPAKIAEIVPTPGPPPAVTWNSEADFTPTVIPQLSPWEQLAQLLLCANEFVFVD